MSEFPREIYAAPEGQFGQGVEPIKLAPWTVSPIYERSQSYVRSDIADEMLEALIGAKAELIRLNAVGVPVHSLIRIQAAISKAEDTE